MIRDLNDELRHTDFDPPDQPDPEDEILEDEDDNDFSEFEALLADATAATEDERSLKAARKRLAKVSRSNHPDAESEREELVATIRRLEEGRVWLTVGKVALFKAQSCSLCQSKNSYFLGWYTEQKHTSDPNARRLVQGKPVEMLPERSEVHDEGMAECCINCVEMSIAIDVAAGEAIGDWHG